MNWRRALRAAGMFGLELVASIAFVLFILCFGFWIVMVAGAVYLTLGMIGLVAWIGLVTYDAWVDRNNRDKPAEQTDDY